MRSARILGTSIAAAMLVLAACGSDDGGDSAEPAADGTEATEAEEMEEEEAPEPADLRLWLNGGDTPDPMREWLVETFEEQNPGSTLAIEEQDWVGVMDRLTTALGSDTESPDVVEVGNTQSATLTTVGAFSDITDLVPSLGGDDLLPGFVEAGSFEGQTYAVPLYAGSKIVFYRKDLFEESNLEIPTTMDEFVDAAITLTEDNSDIENFSGFWFAGQDWHNGVTFLWDAGGELAVEDGGSWTGALSTPESIEGLELAQRLFEEASAAPVDVDESDPQVVWCAGEAGMLSAPGWLRGVLESPEDGCPDMMENVGVFALPGSDGGPAPVLLGGSNIAVSANSQHQELAKKLVELILSDEFQQQYAENGLTPAKVSLASGLGNDEFAQASIESASNAKLTPPAGAWATVEGARILEDFFSKIASGGDVEQLAEETDAMLTEQLN